MYWVLFGIYTLIVAILSVAAIVDMRSYIAQLVDWKFDQSSEGKLAKVNAQRKLKGEPPIKVMWARARIQQYATARMCLPLGIMLFAGMFYSWSQASSWDFYAWGPYTIGAVIWFLSTPLRYIWAVKITCKINSKILEDDLDAELKDALNKFGALELNYGTKRKTTLPYRPFDYSANQIIKHHFKWALSSPRGSDDPPKQYFYTRLLWMNSVIHFLANALKLRWFGGVKLILQIIAYGCASVVWPVAGIASIFYLRSEANEQRSNPDSQPWFATQRSMPAMPKD